ncbi:hypothetical protein Tco_1074831 [Tanacetum coccineum]
MVKVELNKQKGKGTGQGENRPVWNNVQRLNHQNKFVPKAVLTKTGIFLVNTARQNPFFVQALSAVRGYRETAVKASAGCNWRPKRHYWNKVSKYNSGSNSNKNINFKDPLGRPKSSMAWMCDKKNKVLFTDTECLVLSPDFKLPDENKVLLRPVTAENKANKTVGPKEANDSTGTQESINTDDSKKDSELAEEHFVLPLWSSYTSTIKSSEAKNGDEKPKKDIGSKSHKKPVDQEEQAFLEELVRLKRQEKEANDAAEALRKEFAQDTEDLLLHAGAARATSTNTVNTVSTPISTAIPSKVFNISESSYPNSTNYADQDDS